ncbi:DUF1217 domain-containing protein [Gellertiella hungarica]|uniref:DUF1217 domain-containing protein n=1 Tax=Gellertiella hungarica TaxID=1572859 RepID=A0A7W6J3Z1_9HYPH|nr:DUF1217 domain-containing protein [Gellertiella hungarica]MBB4064379.1 hypothetical protein [Gellertiella hungarica]
MSLTLVSLNNIQKDITKTLKQISSDKQVERETAYYKANIGKITSIKDFLANDRLYQYAMKSFGMEDMIYAKGFMRKVLESDLTDGNSFANKLADDRYRKFALAFNFNSATTAVQTSAQTEDVLGLYDQSIVREDDQVRDDTRYFQAMIGTFQTVDQMLTNERVRSYILKNFGYDADRYSYSHIRNILTSDLADPASYVNSLPTTTAAQSTEKQRALNLANAFTFNTDGTVKNGAAQTEAQTAALIENYVLTVPSHKTPSAAAVNRLYYDTKIRTVTSMTEITGDARMWEIVRTALGKDSTFLKATFENIVSSDLNDPQSYVNTAGSKKEEYAAIARLFNFDTSGNTTAGNAQTSTQENTLLNGYNTHYDDVDEETRNIMKTSYKNNIGTITTIDKLFSNSTLMIVSLAAFGISRDEYNLTELRQALTSDLSDPKSYVNTKGDPRLLKMAQDFNFDAKGNAAAPRMAQTESTIKEVASAYAIQKQRFLKSPELDTVKKKVEAETTYYKTEIAKLKTADELLKNRRLIDFNLVALGLDPAKISDDTLKKLFKSDLNDPKSFVNTQTDKRLKQLVSSFNFDAKGNLIQSAKGSVQDRGHMQKTLDGYLQNELEVRQGEENPGVRFALYFQRKAQTITSAYDILGDTALLEVFKTTFSMPDQFSSMKIEQQKAIVEKKLNLADLKDPEKVKKLIQRFTVMYDMKQDQAQGGALSVMSASGSISADTLFTLSQLRTGR